MAGWNHNNANWKPKKCQVCGEEFKPKSGPHKFCSEVCKGKWQYISGRVSTESQYKTISGDWGKYLNRLTYSQARKGSGLSKEILLKILERQDYKCALSGLPLTCSLEKGVKFSRNASIDRIEAGGSYSEENIQLVCRNLNSWRSDTDLGEFIDMCEAVTKFQQAKREREV